MNIAFRADASKEIGSGHIFRCLTLAHAFLKRGWHCTFISTNESTDIVPALNHPNIKHVTPDSIDATFHLLIVDHYNLDHTFEKQARTWARKIMVIDDLANRIHDCDILLDQTYGRDAHDYKALTPSTCHILTGAQYALLRPQFAHAQKKSLARKKTNANKQPHNILISLGSTNIHDVTTLALQGLEKFSDYPLHVDVVLGGKAFNSDGVSTLIHALNHNTDHTVIQHKNVTDMASLMVKADLSLGSGGTTSWERCCLGLPTINIEIADNQSFISEQLHKAGAIHNLGFVTTVKAQEIANALKQLLKSPQTLITMSENAAAICDGRGIESVIKVLENDSTGLVA